MQPEAHGTLSIPGFDCFLSKSNRGHSKKQSQEHVSSGAENYRSLYHGTLLLLRDRCAGLTPELGCERVSIYARDPGLRDT